MLIRLLILNILAAINEPVPTYTTLLATILRTLFVEQLWSFVGVTSLAHVVKYYQDARMRELRERNARRPCGAT